MSRFRKDIDCFRRQCFLFVEPCDRTECCHRSFSNRFANIYDYVYGNRHGLQWLYSDKYGNSNSKHFTNSKHIAISSECLCRKLRNINGKWRFYLRMESRHRFEYHYR